jgi:hypothetical protein
MPGQKRSYTVEELSELAAGLTRLLDAIKEGSMAANAGTIARLEGAASAIQALVDGQNPRSDCT